MSRLSRFGRACYICELPSEVLNNRSKRHIRESALEGFRVALHVLLGAVLIFPFQAAINFVFGNDTWPDWHLPAFLALAFASIWFVFMFVTTLLDLRKEDRVGKARRPTFSAPGFASGIYGITAVVSLGLIVGLHREGDPAWMQFMPLIFVALAFYGWPRTIHCNETAVSQRNLGATKRSFLMLRSKRFLLAMAERQW